MQKIHLWTFSFVRSAFANYFILDVIIILLKHGTNFSSDGVFMDCMDLAEAGHTETKVPIAVFYTENGPT